MAYIGNTVENQGFTPAIDYFNGDGVTVTFTLSRPIASVAQVIVAIDNVIQNPSSSYTVAGSAITFSSAPLSGTNNIWVEYTSLITTYNAISQDPTVIGDIRATGGYLAEGDFGNSFVDGVIVDYVTGLGRVTVGTAEGIALYNGGTASRTALAAWDTSGNLTNTGGAVIQGLTVGKGGGSNAFATAIGKGALAATNTGSVLAVGYETLASNTSGDDITAIGSYRTLYSNTTGNYLVAVGRQALQANTTASFNTAIGHKSSFSNTTGANNSSLGYHSLYSNTTGSANVGLGQEALFSNTTGAENTAVGFQAGYLSTGGACTMVGYQAGYSANTQTICAIGYEALRSSTTGNANTAVGDYRTMYSNTTGANNVAMGRQALYSNTTASNNTAVGYQALYANTTGAGNTAVGQLAGDSITTGADNTCIGKDAGSGLTTPNQNTLIGSFAGYLITTGANNTVLGRYTGNQGGLDIRTASNYIVLSDGDGNPRAYFDGSGNFHPKVVPTTALSANAYIDSTSDNRLYRSTSALKYKQDVRDLPSIDINKFRPVVYKSKCENDDQTKDHFGIIADEVEQAGITELVSYGAEGEVEGFQYERLTVVLLKELQDLKKTVEAQALEIATLKAAK